MRFATPPVYPLLENYQAGSNELVWFIDEAGDQRLRDPKNKIFVLAGCLALGGSMDAAAAQWREVRRNVLGDPEAPIHMREQDHGGKASALSACLPPFFDKADVGRFVVSFQQSTKLDLCSKAGEIVIKATFEHLLHIQAKTLQRDCSAMTVVFEDGPVLRRVSQLCAALAYEQNGAAVPLRFISVTKESRLPWLEMADVMAHTVAGHLRAKGRKRGKFDTRHRAIFGPANGAPACHDALSGSFTHSSDLSA